MSDPDQHCLTARGSPNNDRRFHDSSLNVSRQGRPTADDLLQFGVDFSLRKQARNKRLRIGDRIRSLGFCK